MPKLDATHIADRLRKRLAELEAGAEVAAKDIRALLTAEQTAAMEAAWAEQQQLRKNKRAKTQEEQRQLGWKTKREIQIAAFKQSIADSNKNILAELQKMQDQAEIRQARIYFETLQKALDLDRTPEQARSIANNALTRAGLARMDGEKTNAISKRDRELRAIEAELNATIRKNMTADELEQLAILEEHEASLERSKKK
jgi:hypothetical protein